MLPASSATDAIALEVVLDGERWWFGVRGDLERGLLAEDVRPRYDSDRGRTTFGPISSDAAFVCVREDGGRWSWCATDMTEVAIGEQVLFESRPAAFFQTTGRSDRVGRSRWRRWEETVERTPGGQER